MSSSTKFASTFAPYTPPPDDPSYLPTTTATTSTARPWFPVHTSPLNIDTSYQSGGIPTFNSSLSGGLGAVEEAESQQNQWETRYGTRVDVTAAAAYLLGPISAVADVDVLTASLSICTFDNATARSANSQFPGAPSILDANMFDPAIGHTITLHGNSGLSRCFAKRACPLPVTCVWSNSQSVVK